MAIAFPGAEGYGAGTQGARTGSGKITVYRVTNLNDSGSGSFRAACEASGRRIIVFTVGGTINCSKTIEIRNPYCTILGQTAPGGGITLTRPNTKDHNPLAIQASEVILRYIRIRAGEHKRAPSTGGDCLRIGSKDRNVENVIVDHVTCSWGTDETIDVYQPCKDVTIQWCLVDKAIQHGSHTEYSPHGHGMGVIFGPGCESYSFHHSIVSHCITRTPRTKTKSTNVNEQIGNIIYNTRWEDGQWGSTHIRSENGVSTQRVNILNCTMKIGPDRVTTKGYLVQIAIKDGGKPQVYESGSRVLETNGADVTNSGGRYVIHPGSEKYLVSAKHSVSHRYPITTKSAAADYEDVLAGAGCTIPTRDVLDVATIKEIKNGTGRQIQKDEAEVGGLPRLNSGTRYTDTDEDGLPDAYCVQKTGSKTGLTATEIDKTTGYTWIELWSHELSGDENNGGEENNAPTVDVGPNVTVTLPNTISISATVYDDGLPDSDLTYLWSQVDGPDDAAIETPSAKETVVTFPLPGSYRLRLTASDGELEGSDDVRVTVLGDIEGRNQPPTVDVGPNVTVALPNTISIKATVKDDDLPDGALTYLWTQVEGPDDAVIESPTAKETVVTFPASGAYRLRLTASDGELEGSDELTVTAEQEVDINPPPAGDLTFIVVNGNDDVTFSTDKPPLNVNGKRIYAGHRTGETYNYRALMRFQSVGIPRRAMVATAQLSLFVTGINGTPPALRIYALDEDNSAELTNAADVETRLASLTENYVTWTPDPELEDEWVVTPNLASVINEVLLRPGWNANHALTVVVQPVTATYSQEERLRMGSYDSSMRIAARLEISGVTEVGGLWVWPPIRIGARIGVGIRG